MSRKRAAPQAITPATQGKVYSYCRVSSDEQASGQSLEFQLKSHLSWAEHHKQDLPKSHQFSDVESGGEGKQEKRKQQQALLAMVQPGDSILVSKIDRWSRDIVWGVQSLRELNRNGIKVLFLEDAVKDNSDSNSFILNMMLAVAEQERARIKERTLGTRNKMRAAGKFVSGRCYLGYKVTKDHRLEVDPVWGPIVRSMFEKCVAGYSLSQLRKWLKTEHPRHYTWRKKKGKEYLRDASGGFAMQTKEVQWHNAHLQLILSNRVYIGEYDTYQGEVMTNHHEAIITEALFTQAQQALKGRRDVRGSLKSSSTAPLLGRDLLRCAQCGANMAVNTTIKKGVQYFYYGCAVKLYPDANPGKSCHSFKVRASVVDAQIREAVTQRVVSLSDQLKNYAPKPKALDLSREINLLKAKRGRVVEAFLDGTLDREAHKERTASIDAELAELHRRAEASNLVDDSTRAQLLTTLEALQATLAQAEGETFRKVVQLLASDITVKTFRRSENKRALGWSDASVTFSWRHQGPQDEPPVSPVNSSYSKPEGQPLQVREKVGHVYELDGSPNSHTGQALTTLLFGFQAHLGATASKFVGSS